MRADRLISLMMLLQAKGQMTAQELSQRLEVSERTVYRDVDALSMAGVPIYTQPGTNGGVFLDEHYCVSLTGLTKPEVLALFAASEVTPLNDLGLAKAADETLLKLFASLPTVHQQEVQRLQQRLYIDTSNWFRFVRPVPFFAELQQAVWEDRLIKITYQPVEGQRVDRTIEAYALVAKANIWYVVGREAEGEMRNYRISRFHTVTLLEDRFERDTAFDLPTYWKQSCKVFEEKMMREFPPYYATLAVRPDFLWIFSSYMEDRYEQLGVDDNGWITLRVTFEALGEARMRVLGLATMVRVIEPEELHQIVIQTAQDILAFHNVSPHL